jgi:peptide/nickel transport system substrate-binding protein
MRLRFLVRTIALVGVVGIVAAACSSSSPGPGASGSPTAKIVPGGKIVLGAEQWPECTNPITSCAQASWAQETLFYPTLPRLMQLDVNGKFVPSPLLTGEGPSLANGGLTQNPFSVTYHLNPKAVWEDKTPITSEDVSFTLKALLNTTGTVTTSGYDKISALDATDPATVKITFKSVFVDWPDLFGGSTGFVLKKAAFPNENSSDKPDLKNEFKDSIPFSGGPWKLTQWSTQQAILVANRNFWDHQPILDQVTFVPREDQPTELQAVVNGEVAAIYPQPSDQSLLTVFSANPNVKSVSGTTTYDEALWLNLRDFPFSTKGVPQAFGFAVDREDVVNTIIKRNNPQATVLNCGLIWYPSVQPWCDPNDPTTLPFSKYHYDPTTSLNMLKAISGMDCTGVSTSSDTPCKLNGQPLNLKYGTVSTNTRRTATEALLKEKFKGTGFSITDASKPGTEIFGDPLIKGLDNVYDFANSIGVDPSVTAVFACDQFPTAANNFSGENDDFWCNQQADALMKQSDQELDVTKRADDIHQIGQLEAQDVPALPMYPFTTITAWRADKISGPVGAWNSGVYGAFWNMDFWYCTHPCP